MRLRIIAIGSRQPAWVDQAVDEYLKRIRPPWRVELLELDAVARSATRGADTATQREGERVLAALRERERVILLDELGKMRIARGAKGRAVGGCRSSWPGMTAMILTW